MIKYIPEYIFMQYEKGDREGSFTGFALFFDIKSFTQITEALTSKGRQGAEAINQILDKTFTPVINAVKQQGGFVTGFAGDAFMAVFDDVEGKRFLSVYQVIKNCLRTAPVVKEIGADFQIDARLAVSYGQISWRILKNEWQNEYYFYGSAIEECNSFADLKRDVVFSQTAAHVLGMDLFEQPDEIVYIPRIQEFQILDPIEREYVYSSETVNTFLNKNLWDYTASNEIRDISTAFIYLDKVPDHKREEMVARLAQLANIYHAFVNKLDYSDKGLLAILIFGAPRKYEKTLQRMMYFVKELKQYTSDVKTGISSGRVYAGFTGAVDCQEYTILGYPPNLASRLMMKAELGQTLMDVFSYEQLASRYNFDTLGRISMKGFAQEMPVYRFICEKNFIEDNEKTPFLGRKAELVSLKQILHPLSPSSRSQAVYIHGEPGMGKSRLVKEALHQLDISISKRIYLLCDGILKQPYSPVIKFLKEYFDFSSTALASRNMATFQQLWDQLSQDDEELKRIKSIVGQLLGFRWSESVWELLPPEARPLQERMALVTFFLKIAPDYQLIHVEDGQWIDLETHQLLQALAASEQRQLRLVICCRQQEDGQKVDYQLKAVQKSEIDLAELSRPEAAELVKSIFKISSLPASTLRFVQKKGQGNPLFIEQICYYLQEGDYLLVNGELSEHIESVAAFGITDIIGARIDNLAEEIRKLVYHASVLGVEFDISILSAMINNGADSHADEVVNNCIWIKLKELHYLFAQILFRDTAYGRLLQEKKKQLNLLAAQSYEKLYDKNELKPFYEMVALHYERAGMAKKAYAFYAAAFFVAYRDMRLQKALQMVNKSLEIKKTVLPEDDILIAQSYNCLGLVYFAMGDYRQSLHYSLKALPVFEQQDAKFTLIVAVLNNTGNAYSMLGDYHRALEYHGKSLLLRSINLGEEHPDYALSEMNLANDYLHTGKNEDALQHYQKALNILVEHQDDAPGQLVSCYSNLGAFYLQSNDYHTALVYLKKALPILEKHNSLDKPRAAAVFRQIGNAYDGLGLIIEALDSLNKAREIEEKIFGTNHPRTATTYDYIGRAYKKSDDKKNSIAYLSKALKIYLTHYGDAHPAVAHLYYTMGDCWHIMGERQKALKYLNLSLDILNKNNFDSQIKEDVLSLLNNVKKEV